MIETMFMSKSFNESSNQIFSDILPQKACFHNFEDYMTTNGTLRIFMLKDQPLAFFNPFFKITIILFFLMYISNRVSFKFSLLLYQCTFHLHNWHGLWPECDYKDLETKFRSSCRDTLIPILCLDLFSNKSKLKYNFLKFGSACH